MGQEGARITRVVVPALDGLIVLGTVAMVAHMVLQTTETVTEAEIGTLNEKSDRTLGRGHDHDPGTVTTDTVIGIATETITETTTETTTGTTTGIETETVDMVGSY